ncbi:hypothetical protein CWN49_18220 [Klebsiella michiganensis]|uniref:Uncharacterized protein n=1 Tax=Klebsiella michiganensis TaxID=1134687 RepID=A0A2J5PP81_9ENTR|nr:hypothetical protein CWN49_18220 [Klebsiella michiganensis]
MSSSCKRVILVLSVEQVFFKFSDIPPVPLKGFERKDALFEPFNKLGIGQGSREDVRFAVHTFSC